MNTPIVQRSAPERKTYEAIPHNIPTPQGDLACPRPACRANCYFSSQAERIWCPTCGWIMNLTAEQATEITEALLGISELPIAQYLLILASAQDDPTQDTLDLVTEDRTAPAYRVEGGQA